MEITPEIHKKLGVDLFNYVWTLLDKQGRTTEEDDTMLHAAHASRYHWGQTGTPVNLIRGEWQISRVYSVLNRSEPALYHAWRCLKLCQQHQVADFDLAYAYEALARSFSVAQLWDDARKYLDLGTLAGNEIGEQDDKDWFFKDLSTIKIPDIGEG